MRGHIKDLANPAVDRVLIYAGDGGCYWREGGCGYTSAQYAGLYTRAEAYANAGHCGPEKRVELHDVPDDHIPTLRARVAELEAALINASKEGAASAWDKIAAIGDSVTEKAIRVTAQYDREQAARERGAK